MNFKDIPNYEGKYSVSSDGVVLSLKRWRKPNPAILKQWQNKKGYLCVALQDHNKKQRTWEVHRLVAMAFICNFDKEKQVNHKDGNKKNNKVSNLEMVTPAENIIHAVSIGLINNSGENGQSAKISNNDALKIREIYQQGILSQRKIAKLYGLHQTTVWAILNNKTFINIRG